MKPKRYKSPANIKYVQTLTCEVCLKHPVECHHWITKGAGGDDSLENLHPLCSAHHKEFHDHGENTFFEKHGSKIDLYRSYQGLPKLKRNSKY